MTRKPRADAEANQRHIVAVAHEAFAADGLDIPTREIARRAGLGVATVYRHFPGRMDLIEAVLLQEVARCSAEMQAALADPNSWRALSSTFRSFAERQVLNRGLNEALLGSHPAGRAFATERRAHGRSLERLVERSRKAGELRDDVTVDDVRIGLRAISSYRAAPPADAQTAIARLAGLILAGLSDRDPFEE
jgi:AcrR family transcriptional regulator